MGDTGFHPFKMMRSMRKTGDVLGWQYDMIYLGGDPHNTEQAVVSVRVLKKAIVIRSADGNEESFCSVMIPYSAVTDLKLIESETNRTVAIGEKTSIGEVFDRVLLEYNDNGSDCAIELRMSMEADMYRNSKLCKNIQEYVASEMKNNK